MKTIHNSPENLAEVIHALYRLAISTTEIRELSLGILKILRNSFSTSLASIVFIYPNKVPFIKAVLKNGDVFFLKKGGKKILTKKEQEVFCSGKTFFSKNFIMLPLIFINNLGVITLRRPKALPALEDIEKKNLNTISEEISLIIRNVQLYAEHRKNIIATAKALTKFLNFYTSSSRIHPEYSFKIIKHLAKELGLTKNQVNCLEYAVLLHDAGKIEVPIDILRKEDPLSKEERELIKKHPREGVKILKNLNVFHPIIPIILYHHERYDGRGYPSGLKKKKIPLEARIMAVIDAFDAMIFDRPYKQRMSLTEAIKELKNNRGIQFDPEVVDAFLKVLKKKEIRNFFKKILK